MKMAGFSSTRIFPRVVIPARLHGCGQAHAGIQVRRTELAWIPAPRSESGTSFAGTTEPQAASSYCRSSLHTYFQSRTRRIQMIKTPNFVLFVSFVVKIHFSALVAALPR
jgi:hypothetical protein